MRQEQNTTSASSRFQSRRSLKVTSHGNRLLEDAYERYQQTSKLERFLKVLRNGTTDQQLDMIAEEIWNRIGAKLIERTLVTAGATVGSQI